ncbi:Steroid 5 alpha-reductase 3 [Podochytrium sp. JEL0797]|nr:Steroid 5 alpha-reductase 3 [Podochytrium sp. JEL0797]
MFSPSPNALLLLIGSIRLFYIAVPIVVISLHLNLLGLQQLKSYGKVLGTSTKQADPQPPTALTWILSLTLPKHYFTHFYILGSAVCLALYPAVFPYIQPKAVVPTSIAMLMMTSQVLRRLYECVFVLRQSSTARIHVFHYINGVLFYVLTPIAMIMDNFDPESNGDPEVYFTALGSEKLLWRHVFALLCFAVASIEQTMTHSQLASLRSSSGCTTIEKEESVKTVYKLPTQGYFKLVSAPHYFFEVCIYACFVMVYGFTNLTTWLVVVCVAVELGIAAHDNREWYVKEFGKDKLPKNWKRIVPYII